MKTKDLRGILDLAGAVAVLAGLVFVGLELRQNTEAVEAANLQSQTDASTGFLLSIATDDDLSRIWLETSNGTAQLDELDSLKFFLAGRARWIRMQNAFLQWRRGTLNDQDWHFYEELVCRPGAAPMRFVSYWEDHKPALLAAFVEFVEACWAKQE